MRKFGFETMRGEWTGYADTLAEAIAAAEADRGAVVIRGRCLDGYTEPTAGEYVDLKAFLRAQAAMNAEALTIGRGRK